MEHSQRSITLPSVDRLLRHEGLAQLLEQHGHASMTAAIRIVLDAHRRVACVDACEESTLIEEVGRQVEHRNAPRLRRVFNLTGTVLHTNLGRALMPAEALANVAAAMMEPCNLEFALETGKRGERDSLIEELLVELTGAEAATVVNNNAAAVLLSLSALAAGREVVISRGELIEIGGSFRIPDIMRTAQARLVDVGTTNRTHPSDYTGAVGPDTAAVMKVHTSNFRITGFVAEVAARELSAIASAAGLPLIVDLGAGSLVDLTQFGLPKEPVVREVIAAGSDVVTFSGDKLLGGPQAGVIVGKRRFIEAINRHPLKRALRVSKMTLAALEATLRIYRREDRLQQALPTLRLLTRPVEELRALAERLEEPLKAALGAQWEVEIETVHNEIGSGSLPGESIPGIALSARSLAGSGGALEKLAESLRELPVPVIGRTTGNRLLLDLRCLEDADGFAAQLGLLKRPAGQP
jgi:L-seryl-tRNA(Ser) seleniumtransferase